MVPERNGRTDRQDLLYKYRVSMLTRDKNLRFFKAVTCLTVGVV